MEALILIVTMTGWLTLLFVAGCALENAAKKLRGKRFSRDFDRSKNTAYQEK